MDTFWNVVAILALIASAGFNILYFARHANGKKMLRAFSGAVLTLALIFRLLLLFGKIDDAGFADLIRPWASLIYLLPAADAFVDWQRKRKSE